MALFLFCVYTFLGKFHWGPPKTLALTYFDHSIPFWVWSFWIYVSYYPFLIISCFLMRNYEQLYRFRNACFATMLLHFAIFFLFPISIDRPVIVGNDFAAQVGRFIQSVDAPTNCFPSLHVSLTFLAAFIVAKAYKFLAAPFFLWAFAIAISTITTRQHYFYDVLGALIVALSFFMIFYRSYSFPYQRKNFCPEKNL